MASDKMFYVLECLITINNAISGTRRTSESRESRERERERGPGHDHNPEESERVRGGRGWWHVNKLAVKAPVDVGRGQEA